MTTYKFFRILHNNNIVITFMTIFNKKKIFIVLLTLSFDWKSMHRNWITSKKNKKKILTLTIIKSCRTSMTRLFHHMYISSDFLFMSWIINYFLKRKCCLWYYFTWYGFFAHFIFPRTFNLMKNRVCVCG